MSSRLFRVSAACVALASGVFLRAQDLTLGAPAWFPGTPQSGPVPKWTLGDTPRVPDKVKGETVPGYAIIELGHDVYGYPHRGNVVGTLEAYASRGKVVSFAWELAAEPKRDQVKAALFWLPLIFNPASAKTSGSTATPRLLAVTPIVVPDDLIVKGKPARTQVRFELAADGAVTGAKAVEGTDPRLAEIVEAAVMQWRFAPARTGGRTVASSLVMPVVYGPKPTVPESGTKPIILKSVPPIYPLGQRIGTVNGEVVLAFEVDLAGKAQKVTVRRSNNPAFDEAAITALRKWTFRPGTKDGQPVVMPMEQSIVFRIAEADGTNLGRDAYEAKVPAGADRLPEELKVDVQPRIIGIVQSVYPYGALAERAGGEVEAVVRIDAKGKVVAVKLTKAPRPDIGLAYVAALECMEFQPAKKDGKAVPSFLATRDEVTVDAKVDSDSRALFRREQTKPETIVAPGALDQPLKPLVRRAPVVPTGLASPFEGEAVVDVLIDDKGKVRLPRVVSASQEAIGYAAVQAVSRWEFEPPMAGGKPAVVRVKVPFRFAPKEDAAAPKAAPAG